MSWIADQLLSEARRRQVRVWLEAGAMRYDGPDSALDGRFLGLLRVNQEAIVKHLAKETGRRSGEPLLPGISGSVAASHKWLKPIGADRGAAASLYLLPASGAGPASYRNWRAMAPAGLRIVAVHPPGREQRFSEACFTDVRPLAEEIARHVMAHADRPFALFGHSTGGLVAHEVAKRIGSRADLRMIFVAGSTPPDLVPADLPEQTDEELLGHMAAWSGTAYELLSDPGFAETFLPALRADMKVHASSRKDRAEAEILDIPIIAFAGTDDESTPIDRCAAWSEWSSVSFDLHLVDGGHFFPVTAAQHVLGIVARALSA